ncbi:MAG: hypothetical protein IPJ88_11450 [Myxococcales bacterium]|nr:MAG: hypothetical protein IPJ88_11450 [Myxococcales bacterium]
MTLKEALPVGHTITLQIHFRTTLPHIVARMGYADDFFMAAQWFPKLAKHNPDGSFSTFPYHGYGEFYSDFGSYDLELEVPAAYKVVCNGQQREKACAKDGTTIALARAVCTISSGLLRHFFAAPRQK